MKKQKKLPNLSSLPRLSKTPHIKARLGGSVRKNRRETIFKMIFKKCNRIVPCFVCGENIKNVEQATLEHILPKSKGGTDEMKNLWLSHEKCNQHRGDNLNFPCVGVSESLRFKK